MTARTGKRLFIDIETVPTQRVELAEYVQQSLKPPGNYKNEEAINKWLAENQDKAFRSTALDGAFGELVVLSYAIDDGPVFGTYRDIKRRDEGEYLRQIWSDLAEEASDVGLIWVGHKLMFDMLFLHQRSIVTGARPSLRIPYMDRPWAGTWEDTNALWTGNDRLGDSVSLDKLCMALSIPSPKDGIDGSQVWDAIQAGDYESVVKYNVADVEATREVYRRLTGWGA
jgi:predicted PolB exonuclease-like 3'-5' exonuclease